MVGTEQASLSGLSGLWSGDYYSLELSIAYGESHHGKRGIWDIAVTQSVRNTMHFWLQEASAKIVIDKYVCMLEAACCIICCQLALRLVNPLEQ